MEQFILIDTLRSKDTEIPGLFMVLDTNRTYALQNEKSCKGGLIQTLGNKRKISKKTRPYDGLGSDCVSPNQAKLLKLTPLDTPCTPLRETPKTALLHRTASPTTVLGSTA
jgi:hypothetical protein